MSTTTTETPIERALAFMRLFAKDPRDRSAWLTVRAGSISIDIHQCKRTLVPPHAVWSDVDNDDGTTFPVANWEDGGIHWTAYPWFAIETTS
jgi:hypothetical protein